MAFIPNGTLQAKSEQGRMADKITSCVCVCVCINESFQRLGTEPVVSQSGIMQSVSYLSQV